MFYEKPKVYKNYIEDWESQEQIIVCENGVFKRCKANSISYVVKKTSFDKLGLDEKNIEFDAVGETPVYLEEKPYMKRKIPKGVLDTILRYYQVFAKKNLEVRLNVWYDKVNDNFFIDSPFQSNGSVSVTDYAFDHPGIVWTEELKNEYPDKYELKQRKKAKEIELILDTHSHHNMSCSFSSTDDNADYFTSVGYKLIGVYKTVLKYPTLDLRYFVSSYGKGRTLTMETLNEDQVFFEISDIVDINDEHDMDYDFNVFAKTVGIKKDCLFGRGE